MGDGKESEKKEAGKSDSGKNEERKLNGIEKEYVKLVIEKRFRWLIAGVALVVVIILVIVLKSCGKKDDRELSERIT